MCHVCHKLNRTISMEVKEVRYSNGRGTSAYKFRIITMLGLSVHMECHRSAFASLSTKTCKHICESSR